jgi:hypothetical protein
MTSLCVHQINHNIAVTPAQISFHSLLPMHVNQFLDKFVVDLSGFTPIAIYAILQTILACWQSKKRCLIVCHKNNTFDARPNFFS